MTPSLFSDGLFEQLFCSAPDAMIVVDTDGRIVMANEQTLRMFGYRREELLGQMVELLIPARHRLDHPKQREQYLKNPVTRPMGLWRSLLALHRDGTEIPVDVSLGRVETPHGNYILSSVRDVTERRWMETIIQGNNVTLERIAKGAPLGEILETIVTLFEQSHPSLHCAILRCDPQQPCLHVESAPRLSPRYQQLLAGEAIEPGQGTWHEAVFHGERVVATTTLGSFIASLGPLTREGGVQGVWSEPVVDSTGATLGAVVALCREPREPLPRELDQLTFSAHLAGIGMERDARSKELLSHQEQLRQRQKLEAVGALAGGISHEFNNLLQVIAAYTNFTLEGIAADHPGRDDLLTVQTAAQRATSLTRQLLSFCRKQPLDRCSFDLNGLIADTVSLVRPLIGENITLGVSRIPDALLVFGDYGQIQQVVMNLCINARDAMPDGGQLELSTQIDPPRADRAAAGIELDPRGARALLTVRDTGCGMTAEVRSRIFEPFFTTKELGRGTGLGLSMVYGIIEQHCGQLEVESSPGNGSCFRITLPIAHGKRPEPPQELPAIHDSDEERSGKILVVEDDAAVREALERILRMAKRPIVTAGNGEEAWQIFSAAPDEFSLAILDMVMPGIGGREVAQRIRELRPGFPLIFCTGYDPDANAELDKSLGYVPVLVKPVESKQLLRTVRNSLQ